MTAEYFKRNANWYHLLNKVEIDNSTTLWNFQKTTFLSDYLALTINKQTNLITYLKWISDWYYLVNKAEIDYSKTLYNIRKRCFIRFRCINHKKQTKLITKQNSSKTKKMHKIIERKKPKQRKNLDCYISPVFLRKIVPYHRNSLWIVPVRSTYEAMLFDMAS